ncbi:MAG: tetratricopeptide repeat protein, partial [Treponema porcinum]|uniref:tetratricopeptide repeat protein n=1 Tax=Treponema porcinum TaxID=261392 RepID=UPI002A84116C
LKRDPDNVSIKMSLAYIYAMEGKLKSAESIYELLWKENPDSVEVLTNYIDVLIASEKYEEAEKNLSIMKEKFSDDKNISLFEKKLQELNPKQVELEESDKDSAVITEEDTVLEENPAMQKK